MMEYDQREDLYKVRKQMAKSMTRRDVLQEKRRGDWRENLNHQPTHSGAWRDGFNAGWDALMAEIEPLVANVLTFGEIKRALIPARVRHLEAVERLRALVREGK